ncbi:hypothetical protein [Kallotenue papyrolyticum]|uniref:hypothetical protein n=1 Tax=Kallotenue papyrolyticum TaxID=1325125 RepID=UPI001267C37E|nr:hypothetical protein [Kallotenue papyrolyticum]
MSLAKRITLVILVVLLTGCGYPIASQPTVEQRQAMAHPETLVLLFAELIKQQRYSDAKVLFTNYTAIVGVDDAGKSLFSFDPEIGRLVDYKLDKLEFLNDITYEAKMDFVFEHGVVKARIILLSTSHGWKIENVITE